MPAFTTGTKVFFRQSSAPTGWTTSTTNDNYTLRVVSGSSGGTFTDGTVTTSRLVDTTFPGTIDNIGITALGEMADLPAHTHTYTGYSMPASPVQAEPTAYSALTSMTYRNPVANSPAAGSNGVHTHGFSITMVTESFTTAANFAVKYVDFILAIRN